MGTQVDFGHRRRRVCPPLPRFPPSPGSLAPLERAMDLGQISARGVDRVIRVAWTLADLAGIARPTVGETSYALGLWLGAGT